MKVVIEMTLDDIGMVSHILDQHAPDTRMQKEWDKLYVTLNNLPWHPIKVLSIDTTKK